ncbi:FAD-dependent oxidoreductase [Planctomicrobium sp. SH664]|uniref:FAD-dependent oxidoreductase n=1 Tax=Planctomicrobium sp. SH664 TaxID=3448125 RepID=UPI003F5C40D6
MPSFPASNDRRRFLKHLATGAIVSTAALRSTQGAGSESTSIATQANSPQSGSVLRTFGEVRPGEVFVEAARQVPVGGDADVIVCGAGPAGIGAALAAARAGATTRLIEFAGCLGGVWTAGLLTKIIDARNKSGIMKEILADLAARGGPVAKNTAGEVYDPELLKVILEEKCGEAGVKIHLHTQLVGAVTDDRNRLIAVVTESKSGRQAWTADRFIDCTGDGDLAAQAGCQFDVGLGANCECQPMSMMALLTGLNEQDVSEFIRENGAQAKARMHRLMREANIPHSFRNPTLRHLHSGIYSIMTNQEYGVSATDAAQITEATIRSRAEIHQIVDGLRKLGGPWKNLAVVATAEQIGVREGRRIRGRYLITGKDIVNGLTHPDGVCTARFGFDVHNVHPEGNPQAVLNEITGRPQPYVIPLPALIAADVDGLMMAGRCISGDFIAHSSYRVTGNAVPMGEAAGLTSVVSLKRGVMPHELSWSDVHPEQL